MNAAHDVKKQAQHVAQDVRRQLVEGRAAKAMQETQQQMLSALREQHEELRLLRTDLGRRQKSGGGFPWGLILLVGAGYALYRSNPGVRDQIKGLLNRADPGVQGNLSRAGDAAKSAVDDLRDGRNPGDNFGKVAGEVHRAGEKVVDGAKDKLDDARDQAREIVDDVKRESGNKGMA